MIHHHAIKKSTAANVLSRHLGEKFVAYVKMCVSAHLHLYLSTTPLRVHSNSQHHLDVALNTCLCVAQLCAFWELCFAFLPPTHFAAHRFLLMRYNGVEEILTGSSNSNSNNKSLSFHSCTRTCTRTRTRMSGRLR